MGITIELGAVPSHKRWAQYSPLIDLMTAKQDFFMAHMPDSRQADAVNYLRHHIQEGIHENPQIILKQLSLLTDEQILSFFDFFFSGPHPDFDQMPSSIMSRELEYNRVVELATVSLTKAVQNSGH